MAGSRLTAQGEASSPPSPLPVRSAEAIEAWLVSLIAAELELDPTRLDVGKPISLYGVDSITAAALTYSVETSLGVGLAPTSFLGDLSIADVAAAVAGQAAPAPVSSPARATYRQLEGVEGHPLSRGQQALWFLHQLAPESTGYHIAHALRIRGDLDLPALRRALQSLTDRHPSLRTTFDSVHGEPLQRVDQHAEICFEEEDAGAWSPTTLNERLRADVHRPFDLESGPLLRVKIFARSAREHVLLVAVHHIVIDLWSLAVLVEELGVLYETEKAGAGTTLAPIQLQYADYVRWQEEMLSGPEGERLERYWRGQLAGELPTLNLPTDRPRPPVQTYRGASHAFRLGERLTDQLKAVGKARGATLYMTLLAAFQVLLHRHTGQEDILVGSPTTGRSRSEWAKLVGYFVNPVVLRGNLSGNPTFETLLRQVRRTVLGALDHQDYPFPLLVEGLQPVRDLTRSPLFQAMFVLQKAPSPTGSGVAPFALGEAGVRMNLGGLPCESVALDHGPAQFDLTLMMAEQDGELSASLRYNTDLFDASTIASMAGHFEQLLDAIVADCDQPIATLPLLGEDERHKLLVEWNDTEAPYPEEACVQELFEAQVERTPDATAVVFEDEQLTYRELNRRSNQLAHHLQGLGVGPEVLVGICVERSLEMVVGILGILKAGGAYVPLDPTYPKERLAFMLDDTQAPVLLTQRRLAVRLPAHEAQLTYLDTDWEEIAKRSDQNPTSGVSADNLAYVIYTSGSTGMPKGVAMPHLPAVNLLSWQARRAVQSAAVPVVQFAPLNFDVSFQEIFSTWCSGGALVLIADECRRSPAQLARVLDEADVGRVFLPPVALQQLAEVVDEEGLPLPNLRGIVTAGEQLRVTPPITSLMSKLEPCTLENQYGPTESHVVTAFTLPTAPNAWPARPPIGRPIANTRIYILDSHLQPVPVGVPGELHIGGVGLARGYLNRPELTAEKFIRDPFSEDPADRLYKSGDLARYLPSGDIEFLGRIDHQVKIRGFRIELGEIETVLGQHPNVREAVALAREDTPGDKRLVAYLVPTEQPAPTTSELRRFLKEKLPEHMVPQAFVSLDALPLNPNGKIDRRALPPPDQQRPDLEGTFVAPRSEVEGVLAEIWAEVLDLEAIGVHDNFFELGGDSLKAVGLVSLMSAQTGRELEVRFVFSHPTIGAAAEALDTLGEANGRRASSPRPAGVTDLALREKQASPRPSSSFVQFEHRSLSALLAAGEVAPVDAAALAYAPDALLSQTGLTSEQVVDGLFNNRPLVSAIYETSLGRTALVYLPRFASHLYVDKRDHHRVLIEALELAGRIGAGTVSLTGLLPFATNYGSDLAAVRGHNLPEITTGHATTAAAVVLSIAAALEQAGRYLARERVAFLGLGSSGLANLRLMLARLPHPREITLCGVYPKREFVRAVERELAHELGFEGTVRVLDSHGAVPAELYEATLIVGATNVADILAIDRLQPGTIVVDDSAPHCFRPELAAQRLEEQGDILFTEGHGLRAPDPIRQLIHIPRDMERAVDPGRLTSFFGQGDPRSIGACVLSSLLTDRFEQLLPTVGLVDTEASLRHYEVLGESGFEAAALHCGSYLLAAPSVENFRSRFGSSVGSVFGAARRGREAA